MIFGSYGNQSAWTAGAKPSCALGLAQAGRPRQLLPAKQKALQVLDLQGFFNPGGDRWT
ncbi:MAG: hypothetical protein JWR60_612 [Polaromonas sp.]|nr:hypothetical protein [Polaromonas sp.]